MLGLIIFGMNSRPKTIARGRFRCPHCGPGQSYEHKKVRNWFTLYFIPVIPLNTLGEHIECQRCKRTYQTDVLTWNPDAEMDAEYESAVRRTMIQMMMADGVMDEAELRQVADLYTEITGKALPRDQIVGEAEQVQREGADLVGFLTHANRFLNNRGREQIVLAAIKVATADGQLGPDEHRFLGKVAQALDVSSAHLRGLMEEATPTRSG